jgi:RNA polymerase sigma-70 factor (ECF subfamily)
MNARAFQELHDSCRERVLFGIRGYLRNQDDAEDATAAAFATAYQKRNSFRGESSFYTWVYRIAINKASSALRGKRTMSLDAMTGYEPKALVEPDLMDQALDRAACCRRLRRALKRIPVFYRRTLVDHFVRGYSVKQIAKLRHIPLGTVLSRIFTAKRLLRRAWESRQGQENGD